MQMSLSLFQRFVGTENRLMTEWKPEAFGTSTYILSEISSLVGMKGYVEVTGGELCDDTLQKSAPLLSSRLGSIF